jgi:predicted dehydrogenase
MVSPKIAIMGSGLMGTWHARYSRRCGASICGIVDDQLLKDCRPVVLHVCTPLESHVEIARLALNSGVNVLMEKPLAPDEASTRELLSLAERNGLLLAPVHQFLFQDGFLHAHAAMPSLGRILHIDSTFCSAGGERGKGSPDEIVAEILPHPLSMIERLLPDSLSAFDWNAIRQLPGEWRIVGEGLGVSVSLLISLQGRPTESSMRIVTDGGVVDLDLFHGFATVDRAAVSKTSKIARPFRRAAQEFHGAGWNLTRRLIKREFAYPGLLTLISEFYKAVGQEHPAPINPKETIAVASARDRILP